MQPLTRENTYLPSVPCEIGVGKDKKTRVNFFYRECTSGVSGLGDSGSQSERLRRQINHWKTLHAGERDTIILGDANLCALNPNPVLYTRNLKLPDGERTHIVRKYSWRSINIMYRPLLHKRTRKK